MTRTNPSHSVVDPMDAVQLAVDDFRQETQALAKILLELTPTDWGRATSFKNWTIEDVVLHLYACDALAYLATENEAIYRHVRKSILARRSAGLSYIEEHRERFTTMRGVCLLNAWTTGAQKLCDRLSRLPSETRLPWAGPSMGVRMFAVARQMETWAHGQAIYDVLGIERQENDRLRSIADLGVKTLRWAYTNRGLRPPENQPHVSLQAPSGAIWEWGGPMVTDAVLGSAVDFCRVVTQTRHVSDTQLRFQGATARQWLSIAQCFAGPPSDPPRPGSRGINPRRP